MRGRCAWDLNWGSVDTYEPTILRPGFESQEKHLHFIQFMFELWCEKNEHKRPGLAQSKTSSTFLLSANSTYNWNSIILLHSIEEWFLFSRSTQHLGHICHIISIFCHFYASIDWADMLRLIPICFFCRKDLSVGTLFKSNDPCYKAITAVN